MARKLTFTHPRTGEVFTRTTDADYTHVSVKGGEAKWHKSGDAARARGGEVFNLAPQVVAAQSRGLPLFNDRKGSGCTVTVGGGKCGKPSVKSWTNRDGETFHECKEHS